MAKLINLLVHCGFDNSLITEYLAKVENNKFIVGAKRIYTPPTASASVQGQEADNRIDGYGDNEITTINGVTWDCLHCRNNSMFLCKACQTFTCHRGNNPIKCAGCGKVHTNFAPLNALDIKEPENKNHGSATAKKLTAQPQSRNTKRITRG